MMTRQRFNLVELLVIIAIIALLAALLMPSLQTSLQSVRRASCVNGMRQLGMVMFSYSDNSQGFLPQIIGWSDRLLINQYIPSSSYIPLPGYRELLSCPAMPQLALTPSVFTIYPHIGMNMYLANMSLFFWWGPDGCLRLAKVKSPASLIMGADSRQFVTGTGFNADQIGYYRLLMYNTKIMPTTVTAGGYPDARHLGTANVLWADGHLTPVPCSPYNPYASTPFSIEKNYLYTSQ